MRWQDDPIVEKMLEKATIESFLKNLYGKVYGESEAQQMENGLKNVLAKYEKNILNEKLSGKDDIESERLLKECSDLVCNKNFHCGKFHTSETLLLLSKFFVKVGDYRIACEIIWGFASLKIQEFIEKHKLKVELYSHESKRRFARALSDEIGLRFLVFELCHNSFYTNKHNTGDMNDAMEVAKEFIERLDSLAISEEKRTELEDRNYN